MRLSELLQHVTALLADGGDREYDVSLSPRQPTIRPSYQRVDADFSPTDIDHRLAVCRQCPHGKQTEVAPVGRSVTTCALCGCVVNIKAHAKNATCPIGKW